MNYILYGTETLIINRYIKKIIKTFLDVEPDEFNYQVFDFEEDDKNEIIDNMSYIPFGCDKKVIVIKNCSFLSKKNDKDDSFLKKLLQNISYNDENISIVLVINAEKISETNEIVKLINKEGKVLGANPSKNTDDWRRYISEYCKRENLEIENRAIEELVKRSTSNMFLLENSLSKLKNYDKKITYENVVNLVNEPLDENNFNLLNYLLSGDTNNALKTFRDLRVNGNEAISLLNMISTQLTFYDEILCLYRKNLNVSDMQNELGKDVNPKRISATIGNIRRYNIKKLDGVFSALYQLNKDIMIGKGDRFALFEVFIVNFNDYLNN